VIDAVEIYEKFDGKKQVCWDASSLANLQSCPRYYQYNNLEGWRKEVDATPALTFGSALHAGLEVYDIERFNGTPSKESLRLAIPEALKVGKTLEFSTDKRRTPETLVRSLVWYEEQFRDDRIETATLPDGSPAIEVRFEVDFPGVKGRRISGRIDKLCYLDGDLYIMDRKTTHATVSNYFFDRFSPNIQVSAYTWALQEYFGMPVSGFIIEVAQTAVGFTRFGRSLITRTSEVLDEWLNDTKFWIEQNDHFLANDYWPQDQTGCMNYGGCKYREVCNRAPRVREAFLEDTMRARGTANSSGPVAITHPIEKVKAKFE